MTSFQVTVDANEPERLARFWARLLGYELTPPPDGFETWKDYYLALGEPEDSFPDGSDGADRIRDPEGNGPPFWFQTVPERKDRSVKNRLHLDVRVSDPASGYAERRAVVSARVEEALSAGAVVLRDSDATGGQGMYYFAVLQDPEGNEFCLT